MLGRIPKGKKSMGSRCSEEALRKLKVRTVCKGCEISRKREASSGVMELQKGSFCTLGREEG